MSPSPTPLDAQRRLFQTVFEIASENATQALSHWLGRILHLEVESVEPLELDEACSLLGPENSLIHACFMSVAGRLEGTLVLAFDETAGLALCDLILGRPRGTATAWNDLEKSAALETANIVGSAFLNSLANHWPAEGESAPASKPALVSPGPPLFKSDFAGALLQSALIDQAIATDLLYLVQSRFRGDTGAIAWSLLFVPKNSTLAVLRAAFSPNPSS